MIDVGGQSWYCMSSCLSQEIWGVGGGWGSPCSGTAVLAGTSAGCDFARALSPNLFLERKLRRPIVSSNDCHQLQRVSTQTRTQAASGHSVWWLSSTAQDGDRPSDESGEAKQTVRGHSKVKPRRKRSQRTTDGRRWLCRWIPERWMLERRTRRIEYRTVWDGWATGVQEGYKTAPICRRTKNQIPRGKGSSRCEDDDGDGGWALRDGSVCPRPTLPAMLRWRQASGTLPYAIPLPPPPPLSPRHGYTGCDKSPQNPGRLHAPVVARRVWTARGASHNAAWCFSHVGRIQAGGGHYVRGCRRRRPPCLGRNRMPLSSSLGPSLLSPSCSQHAQEGDGEQFARRVHSSMELPAYREERSWPARHMQTEGHASVLSRAAGVDVTRGSWLKIGDAPPRPQAFSRVPKRARLRSAVSATVYFQREKRAVKAVCPSRACRRHEWRSPSQSVSTRSRRRRRWCVDWALGRKRRGRGHELSVSTGELYGRAPAS